MEIRKSISGYEGIYEVSDKGNVYSLNREIGGLRCRRTRKGQELKKDFSNLQRVTLSKDTETKKFGVSQLVAEAFVPNPFNKPFVYHIDRNKQNDAASNLIWCDLKEINSLMLAERSKNASGEMNHHAKLTWSTVESMREIRKTTNLLIREIAEMFGMSKVQTQRILANKSWKIGEHECPH
ncbi:NUMOD4 domain-containing protein [Thalassotalea psychrophila]|uniref:NUMOD4 domain-containing protein n=1 Tax=Thalassotalea psychrophila TaxID=3065647 RepID=A0ABY9TZL8_9GAMM|nr:NUMOD4 domain-containing protein [Colwelliaceae bacterium SQ149]